jgi:hypothetical protein
MLSYLSCKVIIPVYISKLHQVYTTQVGICCLQSRHEDETNIVLLYAGLVALFIVLHPDKVL